VLRASYISGNGTMMGTVGVANLIGSNAASKAGQTTGTKEIIAPLAAQKGPTSKLGNGTGVVQAEIKGHYLILMWAEFTSLKSPSTAAQRSHLQQFAAALVTVGEAAFRGLSHLGVKAGQTVLIHGAAGSVGTIAVQLAVARGATVIGTAAPGDLDRVTALGAAAVPYGDGWADRARAIAPDGVDAVFDTSGAGVLADSVDLTGDVARVITIADESAAQYGVRFTGADPADRYPEALPELAGLAATGHLVVPIWRSYPLAEAARAHADLEAGRNQGKIVLLP